MRLRVRRRSAARKLLGKGVLLAMVLPRLLVLGMLRGSCLCGLVDEVVGHWDE